MSIPFKVSALFDSSLIGHGFFGRQGGVSQPPYDTLNCGFNQGDCVEDINQNFHLIADSLGCEKKNFLLLNQVHGATVRIETTARFSDRPWGDAMVTASPGLVLSIITADCVPVLLVDLKNDVIGAIHSGWQSAYLGIVGKTIEAMESLGANRSYIIAAIGPCIQQPSYEVDDSFKENFLSLDLQNQRYFNPSKIPTKWLFDLPKYVENQLKQNGVELIDNCQIDTFNDPNAYFSYRYSSQRHSVTGRQLSAIYIKE